MTADKFEPRKFSEEEIRTIVAEELKQLLHDKGQDEATPSDTETKKVQEGTGEKAHLLNAIQGLLHTLTVTKLKKVLDFIENIEVEQ